MTPTELWAWIWIGLFATGLFLSIVLKRASILAATYVVLVAMLVFQP